jgi:hypothetical protein
MSGTGGLVQPASADTNKPQTSQPPPRVEQATRTAERRQLPEVGRSRPAGRTGPGPSRSTPGRQQSLDGPHSIASPAAAPPTDKEAASVRVYGAFGPFPGLPPGRCTAGGTQQHRGATEDLPTPVCREARGMVSVCIAGCHPTTVSSSMRPDRAPARHCHCAACLTS